MPNKKDNDENGKKDNNEKKPVPRAILKEGPQQTQCYVSPRRCVTFGLTTPLNTNLLHPPKRPNRPRTEEEKKARIMKRQTTVHFAFPEIHVEEDAGREAHVHPFQEEAEVSNPPKINIHARVDNTSNAGSHQEQGSSQDDSEMVVESPEQWEPEPGEGFVGFTDAEVAAAKRQLDAFHNNQMAETDGFGDPSTNSQASQPSTSQQALPMEPQPSTSRSSSTPHVYPYQTQSTVPRPRPPTIRIHERVCYIDEEDGMDILNPQPSTSHDVKSRFQPQQSTSRQVQPLQERRRSVLGRVLRQRKPPPPTSRRALGQRRPSVYPGRQPQQRRQAQPSTSPQALQTTETQPLTAFQELRKRRQSVYQSRQTLPQRQPQPSTSSQASADPQPSETLKPATEPQPMTAFQAMRKRRLSVYQSRQTSRQALQTVERRPSNSFRAKRQRRQSVFQSRQSLRQKQAASRRALQTSEQQEEPLTLLQSLQLREVQPSIAHQALATSTQEPQPPAPPQVLQPTVTKPSISFQELRKRRQSVFQSRPTLHQREPKPSTSRQALQTSESQPSNSSQASADPQPSETMKAATAFQAMRKRRQSVYRQPSRQALQTIEPRPSTSFRSKRQRRQSVFQNRPSLRLREPQALTSRQTHTMTSGRMNDQTTTSDEMTGAPLEAPQNGGSALVINADVKMFMEASTQTSPASEHMDASDATFPNGERIITVLGTSSQLFGEEGPDAMEETEAVDQQQPPVANGNADDDAAANVKEEPLEYREASERDAAEALCALPDIHTVPKKEEKNDEDTAMDTASSTVVDLHK